MQNGNFNHAEIKDPAIDALFDKAKTVPPAEAAAIYTEINHKVMEARTSCPSSSTRPSTTATRA